MGLNPPVAVWKGNLDDSCIKLEKEKLKQRQSALMSECADLYTNYCKRAFGGRAPHGPAVRNYSAAPDFLAGLREREGWKGAGGRGRKGGKGRTLSTSFQIFWLRPCSSELTCETAAVAPFAAYECARPSSS